MTRHHDKEKDSNASLTVVAADLGGASPREARECLEWLLTFSFWLHRKHVVAVSRIQECLESLPASQWQPIEAYIDNGGTVLVSDGMWSWEARYDNDRREWWPVNIDWTDAHGSALVGLTHWMPMPIPAISSTKGIPR